MSAFAASDFDVVRWLCDPSAQLADATTQLATVAISASLEKPFEARVDPAEIPV
jgi:hypothetical protein